MPITSAITRRSQRHRNRQRHRRHSLSRKRSYAHTRRTRRWAKRKVCRRGGMPGVSHLTDLHESHKMTETNQIRWAAAENEFYCTQPDSQDGYIPCKFYSNDTTPNTVLYLHTVDTEGIIHFLNNGNFSTNNLRSNWLPYFKPSRFFIKKKPFGEKEQNFFERTFNMIEYNCYFALSQIDDPSFYCLMLNKDKVLPTGLDRF